MTYDRAGGKLKLAVHRDHFHIKSKDREGIAVHLECQRQVRNGPLYDYLSGKDNAWGLERSRLGKKATDDESHHIETRIEEELKGRLRLVHSFFVSRLYLRPSTDSHGFISPWSMASFRRYISQSEHLSNATPVPEQAVHATRGSLTRRELQAYGNEPLDLRITTAADAGGDLQRVRVVQVTWRRC